MRIARVRWTAHRIPFARGFATSQGGQTHRGGVVVELTTEDGVAGLGEVAQTPGREDGSLDGLISLVEQVARQMACRDTEEARSLLDALEGSGVERATRAGFDIALLDAAARAQGISVARLLSDDARASVEVNALISAPGVVASREEAARVRAADFRTVKLKVGMAASVEEERARVAAVRDALGPDVRLRLDANGAWDADRAIRTIVALEAYDIEFVEQPTTPGDLIAMRRVRDAVRVPIAADEDVTDVAASRRVLDAGAAQILVVKPLAAGGLRPARRIIDLALQAGAQVVVTTTIDTGVGVAAALHLAATLPHGSPACGLATGGLLESDLLRAPLVVRDGLMRLPDAPGLGVDLDGDALERYAVARGEASA